jgi:hypothetical protein
MENNTLSGGNDDTSIRNPKLLKDLIKLKQLQLKIEEIESGKQKDKRIKGSFRKKHFFIYILPALIQLCAVFGAYFAVVKSKFFESANYYAEARNLRLQIDEDSLKSHKTKLYDSISKSSLQLNRQREQLETFNTANLQLRSTNSSLAKDIVAQNNSLYKLGLLYYGDLVDNYSGAFYALNNKQIENIVFQSGQKSNQAAIIKQYIDNLLSTKFKDSITMLTNKIKLSALGYFCFKKPIYRSIFVKNLKSYSSFFFAHFGDQPFDDRFMNILRYKDWPESDINENFLILFNDAWRKQQKDRLAQIASWTTYHPLETSDIEKIKVMPEFWVRQHRFLMNEISGALLNETLVVKDQNFFKYYKNIELSLLCECPQCYLSLEAEFLKRNFVLFKSMNTDKDSVKFSFSARKKDGVAELYDAETTPRLKFFILLSTEDVNIYSSKLLTIYQKAIDLNGAITFDRLGSSIDFDRDAKLFEDYYEKSSAKFKFWLSLKYADDIDKKWFQDRLLALKY